MGMIGRLFFHGIISLVCNATLLLSLSYSVPAVSPGDPSDGAVLAKALQDPRAEYFNSLRRLKDNLPQVDVKKRI